MDKSIVGEIDKRLSRLVQDQNISIPWAIESGSRAWGFPSPDSDYDCRFVFARSMGETLSLFPKRDVIELPITPIYDVGGWELGKALKLLLKGNAVIIEWMMSPIIYRGDELFHNEFLELAQSVVDRNLIANHYLHLAISMRDKTLKGSNEVPLKKLFYILRPLMAIDWLLAHPRNNIAPMHFPTLMAQLELSKSLRDAIESLLETKSQTRELGTGTIPEDIANYIVEAFERAESHSWPHGSVASDSIDQADAFHLKWIRRS